ncbi:MAG: hypothetical protein D6683_05560, partial [Actinomyces sp.]
YGFGAVSFAMPNLLGKLGADVLAINPYISTPGATRFSRDEHAAAVSDLVRASAARVGAVFSPGGEQLTVIDDRGRVVSDARLVLALVALHDDLDGARVVAPVSFTRHLDDMVRDRGGELVLTPTSSAAIMAASAQPFVVLGADTEGRLIVPEFMPCFDAVASFAVLLDRLAGAGRHLSEVLDEVPEVHMTSREVVTPWEQKGAVMRILVEQSKDRRVDLVDGVRIHHEQGWVLVLPDPDEPITRIIAEGDGPLAASRLADEYVRRLEQLVRS